MIESAPRPKSLESLEGHERCRITVNNIVQTAQVEGETDPVYFAVLDPRKYKEKGERRWQPLGGAIRLTPTGQKLVELIGGEMLEKTDSKDSGDARFTIPTEKFIAAMELFSRLRPAIFEDTVGREVFEELTEKEFDGFPPILSESEAMRVGCMTHGVLHELPKYEGVSGRFGQDMPYARVTYLSTISMPKDIFEKMRNSGLVHIFTKEEAAQVIDARLRGEVAKTAGEEGLATTTMLTSKNPSLKSPQDSRFLYAEDADLECSVFLAVGEAFKRGQVDVAPLLKNLQLLDGRPANLSEEQIKTILEKDVPTIRTLVMEPV